MNRYETNRDYMPSRSLVMPRISYTSYSLNSITPDIPRVDYRGTNISDMRMSYEEKK